VFNTEQKVRIVIAQLLKLTTEPWELLVLLDGCTDESRNVVMSTVQHLPDWPLCDYSVNDVDAARVWISGTNLDGAQGDIGKECLFLNIPRVLTRVLVLSVPVTGIFETAGNNLLMRNSRGDFFDIVHDDRFMTQFCLEQYFGIPHAKVGRRYLSFCSVRT
jgi:glycosyltransferase involved in cell wall biosynthesis